jgi:S-adenosylmethionine synthetase
MNKRSYLFTSESVSEGHPDKLADRISDAVLDHIIAQDPMAKVACETLVANGLVVVAGEFRINPPELFDSLQHEIPLLVRGVIRETGYDGSFPGIHPDECEIRLQLTLQSLDIHQGVELGQDIIGAGDQGMVFGYATNETPELIPLSLLLSHRLVARLSEARHSGEIPWLRPDAKSQVTVRYKDGRPDAVEAVIISTQHADGIDIGTIRETILARIVDPLIPASLRGPGFRILVNPTGRFVEGGPAADTGVTGRKMIVDTYGGHCPHGGGAFSGKDPTKVDRSAAYMARYIAKSVVAGQIAQHCTIQIAYAIGEPEPVSVLVDTGGTAAVDESVIESAIHRVFDLTPAGIIRQLDLRRPIYQSTATYGHFGRELSDFTWERLICVNDLRDACGLPRSSVWRNVLGQLVALDPSDRHLVPVTTN